MPEKSFFIWPIIGETLFEVPSPILDDSTFLKNLISLFLPPFDISCFVSC
jgi:hypothetical protein